MELVTFSTPDLCARRTPLMMGLLVVLLVAMASGRAHAEPSFEGTYTYAGGESQRAALSKAIEDVVSQMNALIRSVARTKLTSRIGIAPRLSFRRDGETLILTHPPLPSRPLRFGGQPLAMRNQSGDDVTVVHRRQGQAIVEIIRCGRSTRTITYRLQGQTMIVSVNIQSPFLPTPIRFALSYHRVQ